MATKHYVVKGEGEDSHLVITEGGTEFADDGTKVFRVVLANGDEHLINFGDHRGARHLSGGILSVSVMLNGPWLRSYRDWCYYEDVPYEVDAPVESTIF